MEVNEIELAIDELADRVGVPVRTVRFYISEGLLPGPAGRGKAATYGEEHLLRLRLIRLLAEQRVPLEEIRRRLAPLSIEEVRALLAEETQHLSERERAARQPSPKEYVSALLRQARAREEPPMTPSLSPEALVLSDDRGVPAEPLLRSPFPPGPEHEALCCPPPRPEAWERWELAPGVELLVRSDVADRYRSLIERLLQAARHEPGHRRDWE